MQRKDDIFNPENRKEKKFLRKSNVKKLIILIIGIAIFLFGSREFIYGKVVSIDIRDIRFKKVESMKVYNGSSDYFITNKSLMTIKLQLIGNVDFTSNYNDETLRAKQVLHIKIEANETGVVEVHWIKE